MENVGYQEMKNMGYHGIEVSMEYYRVGAALWGNERWSAVRYTGTSCVIVRLPATQAPWTGPNPSPTLLASSHEGAPGQQCHGGPHRPQHPTGTQVCEWEWGSLGTQILTLHGDMGDTGWVCLNSGYWGCAPSPPSAPLHGATSPVHPSCSLAKSLVDQ